MLDQPRFRRFPLESEAVSTIDRALRDEQCHRCGGLMVHDNCLDVLSDSGEVEVKVMRCCACGELIDPTILRNRMRDSKVSIETASHLQGYFSKSEEQLHSYSLMTQILETWSAAIRRGERQSDTVTN